MADESIIPWREMTRESIKGVIQGIYDWFRGRKKASPAAEPEPDSKPGILIIGPGGTGKTTLARLLSGEFDWLLDVPGEYKESLETERYTLVDDPGTEVVVPPGQQHRREWSWPEVYAGLARGDYRGVILLASFGYHNLTTASYKDHELYDGDKDGFVREYLEARRAEEVRVFRQLVTHLGSSPRKVWLLAVVTKQDLWGSRQGVVDQHYRSGEFADLVQEVRAARGAANFRYELVLGSLLIANFETSVGERLKANEAGYDHAQQVRSLRRLIQVIDELRKWEG
jgi:hypothetical protein